MRLFSDARAQARPRRLPPGGSVRGVELALSFVALLLAARLLWVGFRPPEVDAAASMPPVSHDVFAQFDPFFRRADSGPTQITEADLRLFGVRQDQASGRGAAIIGLPDGRQVSIAVGEPVAPGLLLGGVGPDNVTLLRDGKRELLIIEQPGTGR